MNDNDKKQYQHVLFAEPEWEPVKTFEELDIEISGKENYIAEEQVQLGDYNLTVKNDPSAVVTLERVEEERVEYKTKFLNFVVKYKSREYKIQKEITVAKKQLCFDGSQISTNLKYNGAMQSFAKSDARYNFFNAEHKDIGSYEVEVTHKSENYTFPDGDVFKTICHISEPDIEDVKVTHNENLHTEDKLNVSKVELKINGEEKTYTSGISVDYKNSKGHLLATTNSVDVTFNFHDYQIRHTINVSVSKKKIAKPEYVKEYEYTGKVISPASDNEYWKVKSPQSKDVGEYDVTFEIKDKANYEFEDGSEKAEGKYKINKTSLQYKFKNNKVDFTNASQVEYFDEKTGTWKTYKKTTILKGKVKFRAKDRLNYNETTIDFKVEKEKAKEEKKKSREVTGKLSKGAIAGISIAVIGVIGSAIGVLIVLLLKNKKESDKKN